MRTMLRVTIPVEAGNAAVREGKLQEILEATTKRLAPECAYYFPERGRRSCLMVFDLEDPSEIPSIAEPFFMGLDASIELIPVMNGEDLAKGLAAAKRG